MSRAGFRVGRVGMVGLVGLLGLIGLVGACSPAAAVKLTVFGAASLKPALTDLTQSYTDASRDSVLFEIATGSSAMLRTQIEQGAPADVFLSADTANPQALADGGLTDGALVAFATNQLTLIVAPGNPAHIGGAADLARPGVKIIAAGDEVPITGYANQVVTNLAGLAGYPPDFARLYATNVVSREDNVAAVVSKIALGEGDVAIVYASDAARTGVQSIDLPDAANVTATYAGVVLKASPAAPSAHAFLDWLRGQKAWELLGAYGFGAAP
jgi:molybdate transport system substrate-binding protein